LPLFYLLTPYPKTVLREELLAQGLVTNPDDFAKYTGLHANVRTAHLTVDELQREVWQMVAKFYGRDWMRYTVIKRVYPWWFVRKSIAVLPNVLRRKLGVKLGLTTEDELFRRDMERGVLYRHVEV
jgi:anaerobic magnesium-protoporphyrin IX monomethyl ester cyclase